MRNTALVVAAVLLASSLAGAQPKPPKWPSSSAPRPLPARDVKFPPYELRTLPNGLQVVVVVHDEQPAVSLRLLVRAGGAQDPVGKPGVAAMTTSLLDQGTATQNAQQVADTIDSAGGRLETGLGRDLSFTRVVVMKDGLSLGMSLLADVIRHPAFAGDELERQRKQTLSALQVSNQDPDYLANAVFDRLVYGANPYGYPGNGTADTVQRITRDDLVAYHRAYFTPNNSLLAVVGDVTVDEAMEAVTKAFGDWERREVPAFNAVDPPEPARRVLVIDKPDSVQTEIRVGHLGIPRKNPDYMAVDLAIKILGGEGANRLHRVLRAERGLTYGASAQTETLKRGGEFVALTNTRSEATGEVLRLIVDEYWRLRRERVNDRELEEAKAYLAGHFPLTIETPGDIATQVLNGLFYELPLQELQTFRQRVNAVTVDDVERVAYKYLRPDRLSVVLVGNAAAFVDQLRGVGFGKYDVIRLSELDVTTADLKKKDAAKSQAHPEVTPGRPPRGRDETGGSRWPAGLPSALDPPSTQALSPAARSFQAAAPPPPPAQPETAESLIRRAVGAKGGLERLKSVKTVQATATTTVMLPQGPMRTETTTYIEYPEHFRVEAHVARGDVVQVYGGEANVWAQDPTKGVIEVPPQVRRDFKASVDRDLIPLLIKAASGNVKLRLLDEMPVPGTKGPSVPGIDKPIGAESGRPAGVETGKGGTAGTGTMRGVEVSGGDMEPVAIYIDSSSGMVLRQSYRLPGGMGTADELFSDYRDVDGLKVAFKASVRRNDLPVLERVVTDFKLNVPLRPGLFDRPSAR